MVEQKDDDPYDNYTLKTKLREQFQETIVFAERVGLEDVVIMKEETSRILRTHYKQNLGDGQLQKKKTNY